MRFQMPTIPNTTPNNPNTNIFIYFTSQLSIALPQYVTISRDAHLMISTIKYNVHIMEVLSIIGNICIKGQKNA